MQPMLCTQLSLQCRNTPWVKISVCTNLIYPPASNLDKYEVHEGKDCYGNDLHSVDGVGMDECDQVCMANVNCMGITYNTRLGKCHQKHACPELTDHPYGVSYMLKSESCHWKIISFSLIYRLHSFLKCRS